MLPTATVAAAAIIPAHALASFYTLNNAGNVHRWDSPTSAQLIAQTFMGSPEGLAAADDGTIYVIGWQASSLTRVDPVTHQVTPLGQLQPPTMGSFFKDLAWDPSTHQLIALHWSNENRGQWIRNFLVAIDPATMQTSILGDIAGLSPPNTNDAPCNGLAIDSLGNRFVQLNNRVYRLTGSGGLNAEPLPMSMSGSSFFNGLGIDPLGGEMLASGDGGVWSVAADGSNSPLVSGGAYRDVAFPVPAPGTLALLPALAWSYSRRRRMECRSRGPARAGFSKLSNSPPPAP